MNKRVNKFLPNNNKIEVTFKNTELSSYFNVKDKIDFEHNHDIIYHTNCPETTFIDVYVVESAHRIAERKKDHRGGDHISNVLKHSIEKSQKNVNTIDIIHMNFHNNIQRGKVAEAL